MRPLAIIFGVVIAAVGGVIAYRAYFLDPAAAVVISEKGVRELPDTFRIVAGMLMLVIGAFVAFTAARRKR